MKHLKNDEYLYQQIADNFENQIKNEIIKTGEKLPSIRIICNKYGVSLSTALQAYYQLESKSLIEARPQSGYYVTYYSGKKTGFPKTSQPSEIFGNEPADDLISEVFQDLINPDETVLFSLGLPSVDLIPIAKLSNAVNQAIINLPSNGTRYENAQGNLRLRRQIAHRAYAWNGNFKENDIITTSGCINAIALCLLAITQPGNTIAVESPCYFGVLQLAKSLQLNVLEMPTNAQTGIEIDALKRALQNNKIDICLLVTNFSNPSSSCIPDENKKEITCLLEKYGVPLIEDDIYGDIYFGKNRPKNCKSFDESGNVLLCSSVSKTLAPGYRVGWVIAGKHKNKILKSKLLQTISSTGITHEAIAAFLENERYEHHLRNLRNTLFANSIKFQNAICEYFPSDTKVTRPQGGYFLWLELNKKYNTTDLYHHAMKYKISIAPGRMFSLQNLYNNCMRMNFGWIWNQKIEQAIKTIGNLLKK